MYLCNYTLSWYPAPHRRAERDWNSESDVFSSLWIINKFLLGARKNITLLLLLIISYLSYVQNKNVFLDIRGSCSNVLVYVIWFKRQRTCTSHALRQFLFVLGFSGEIYWHKLCVCDLLNWKAATDCLEVTEQTDGAGECWQETVSNGKIQFNWGELRGKRPHFRAIAVKITASICVVLSRDSWRYEMTKGWCRGDAPC